MQLLPLARFLTVDVFLLSAGELLSIIHLATSTEQIDFLIDWTSRLLLDHLFLLLHPYTSAIALFSAGHATIP